MKLINLCMLIMVVFLLSSCHQKENKLVKTTHLKNLEGMKHSVSVLPVKLTSSYKPVANTLIYTNYVGDINHPTIDGGIINSVDKPVNEYIVSDIGQTSRIKDSKIPNLKIIKEQNANYIQTSSKKFEDSWATSERVKKELIQAAKNGKLDYVLKKSNEMNLPASVAVVPIVESNYKTNAISTKGAAGAWQLMPVVARDYGIKDNDRFSFNESTNTALKLLDNLHNEFGNWELAFAAYNAGSQRVKNALLKSPNAKDIDDLDLPRETKMYVDRIMEINQEINNMEVSNV